MGAVDVLHLDEGVPMTQAIGLPIPRAPKRARPAAGSRRIDDALAIAGQRGLLSGARTLTVRGRMPSSLVEQARLKTGIQSDSRLIEAALANIVAADDYGDWLLAQRNTVSKDLDLEF
jgi:hypothetical protein